MSDKRKGPSKRKPGRPSTGGRKPGEIIYVRVDPAIGKALDGYIEKARPKTTRTAVIELALEEYLSRAGLWPPPDAGE